MLSLWSGRSGKTKAWMLACRSGVLRGRGFPWTSPFLSRCHLSHMPKAEGRTLLPTKADHTRRRPGHHACLTWSPFGSRSLARYPRPHSIPFLPTHHPKVAEK